MKRKKTIWSDETVMVEESTELVVSEEESLQRQDFMK